MKIGVLLKIVPDTETKIKIKADASGIDEVDEINYAINPYDEYALEEAIRLKESLNEGEVVIISAGIEKFEQKPIRMALAMGADRAIYIIDDVFASGDSFLTAKTLAKILEQESFNMIFAGKQAVDYDNSQVPQIVASLLNIPCVINISKFEFKEGKVTVKRETEGGTIETHEMVTPCIVGVTKGLNEPRHPTLPGIMKAKQKELKTIPLTDLRIDPGQAKTKIKKYSMPPERQAGKIVKTAEKLAALLREEIGVI